MTYATQVAITATTAWDTLGIVARQSFKDVCKVAKFSKHRAWVDTRKSISFTYSVYILLTSPEAKRTYKTLWNLAALIAVVVWAIGVTAYKWLDREAAMMAGVQAGTDTESAEPILTESEVEPTASEIPTPAPVAVVHSPKPVKFPAFILGGLHEQTRPIAGLLPAGVSSKPASARKSGKSRKNRRQLVAATV